MSNFCSVPFVHSGNKPITVSLLNDGRVMILKDALFNPDTQRWHDIKLVRTGWTLFGFELGGAGKFTSITQDEARQIQMTYGIVLKTLNLQPDEAAFWGDAKQTSYFTGENAARTLESGKPFRGFLTRMFTRDNPVVKTSYAYGVKKDDVILSAEDAAFFGREKMTIHDAFNAVLWNRSRNDLANSLLNGNPAEARNPLDTLSVNPISDDQSQAAKNGLKINGGADPAMANGVNGPAGQHSSKTAEENGMKTLDGSNPDVMAKNKVEKDRLSKHPNVHGTSSSAHPITALPSVPPTYRAESTPIHAGYDYAPFLERKRRVVEHLDQSHPFPFSAFVDQNQDMKIDKFLFRRMEGALRRLALDPEAGDEDAKYMKGLFRHWFRAAYHYLERNSTPGDGYEQILSDISREIKEPRKAQAKAKELYWRKYATEFWMTLIDHYPRNKMVIDALQRILSTKTSLKKPWFWE